MITLRKANDRGHANHGWLNTHHTFSFADYYDPAHMGFRALRVINDDRVAAGRGFGAHAHRDMEILTYVLEGTLAHKDSMGHIEKLGTNEIQRMSAGTGVVHSEFNASETEPVHLLQIWLLPGERGITPSYQQIAFSPEEKQGRLRLLAAPAGSSNGQPAASIHTDARVYVGDLGVQDRVEQPLAPGRHAYVQVARGSVTLNGQTLAEGDGAAITGETALTLQGSGPTGGEVLLFDLL